jgi:hypothetical protein
VEKRQTQRKDLRVKAILTLDNGMKMTVRTADIGKFGLGVTGVLRQLDVGQTVHVAFEMPFSGQIHNISVNGRVSHCTNTPHDGFRTGVQFTDLNSDSVSILSQYVGG